jgi:hypothetical protein
VGATVRLVDATGRTVSATTDAQGYYRLNITRFTPPYVLTLTTADGEERHHSFSTQAPRKRGFITINLTGLTDKLASDVAIAGGQARASQLTPAIVAANPSAITAALAQLRQAIRNQILAAGLTPETFDPVTVFFRPNLQGHDLVLETVAVYLDANGATQLMPKPQTACTTPRRWFQGGNLCTPTTTPGFIPSGQTLKLQDTTNPLVGSAEYACTSGSLSTVGTPTCAPPVAPQPCAAPSATWSVGGSSCSADTAPAGIAHGATLTLTDSGAPTTGAIVYACSNGTLGTTGTPSCTTAVAARPCAAPAGTWSVGSQSCQADAPPATMVSGTQQILQDATGTASGSIVYACNDSALSVVGAPQCGLTPGTCAAPPANWSVGTAQCTADAPPQAVPNGLFVEPRDTQGRDTGSILWRCSAGQLLVIGDPVCRTTQPQSCNVPDNWVVGGVSCLADTPPPSLASDATLSLTDTVGPSIGGITYSCSNGNLSVTGTPSCRAATAQACDTSKLAGSGWTVGNNQCQPDSVPATAASGSTVVLNDTVGDMKGKLTLQCVDGGLFTLGDPVCEGPPPPPVPQPCSVRVSVWGKDPYTCAPTTDPGAVTIQNGSTFTWVDSTGAFQGSHTLACKDSGVVIVSSVCNYSTDSSGARPSAQQGRPAQAGTPGTR